MTRIAWQEALTNAVLQHKHSGGLVAATRRAWLTQAVSGESALKGRGLLATALSDAPPEDSQNTGKTPTTSPKGGAFSSFTFGLGKNDDDNSGSPSHVQRLLRLRSERALSQFVGGAPPSPGSSPQPPAQRKNTPDLVALQNLHRGARKTS